MHQNMQQDIVHTVHPDEYAPVPVHADQHNENFRPTLHITRPALDQSQQSSKSHDRQQLCPML